MDKKLVLITGGSSGIGKATAEKLHQQGATIILQARNLEKLESAAQEISPSGTRISYYSTDLTNANSVEQSAKEIIANEGLPDVVINSAGSGDWLSFKEADMSHFKETMDSPYLATSYTCKAFYDLMQERGTGHFIIINSVAGYFSFPGATGYSPARWAMLGFAKSLQADLHGSGFKVSMIALGKVDSPYFSNNPVSENRIPRVASWFTPTLSVQDAGIIVANTVHSKKETQIKPTAMALFVSINKLFPGLIRWMIRVTQKK